MTPSEARDMVESVLQYFDRFMQCSRLQNDLRAIWHWQECWVLVFTHFFGSCTPPRVPLARSYPATVEAKPEKRPPWFVAKYSRPARKVIGQMTDRVPTGRGRGYFEAVYDLLVCGHKMAAKHNADGTRNSRWRYCAECPPKGIDKCQQEKQCLPPARGQSSLTPKQPSLTYRLQRSI